VVTLTRSPLLAPYIGQNVAWSPDGSQIIASAEDELRLDAAIRAAGYDPAEIVVSSIPDEDTLALPRRAGGEGCGGFCQGVPTPGTPGKILPKSPQPLAG
jgi:hypothetical protein